jgi:methylated-DNA-[protein]-cysteine S-methyltransferase
MTCYYSTFPTPAGKFSVAVDDTGAIVATAFGGREALSRRGGKCQPAVDIKRTAGARQQVEAYFEGSRQGFDLPLSAAGTGFQKRVWAALGKIPFGKTLSYGEVAAKIGAPKAARAVGRACGTNPICLIVPCHRVIGANGSLTGFAFGEKIKRQLLEHEGLPQAR